MLVKYTCAECNLEKEVDVKIPITCGNVCRVARFKKQIAARKEANRVKNLSNQALPSDTPPPTPPGDEAVNIPPDVPTGSVIETQNQNDQPATPSPESGGSENNNEGNLGQGTPSENSVDTPPQPTENPGGEQGQA